MHSKRYQIFRITMIAIISFISGIILTVVAAAAYDASIDERATKLLDAIKSNASDLDPELAVAYYGAVRLRIDSLIQVLTKVDEGLLALSGDENFIPPPPPPQGTGGTTPPPTGIVCTGTYPKDDPNASLAPNGGFVLGPSASDLTNRVWKYKYAGTCTFDCKDGYSYNTTKNVCEKGATFTSSECILDMSTKNNCDTSIVLKKENHIACYEVLSHPLNTSANPNKVALNTCNQESNWGPQKKANTSAWDISYDAPSNMWTSKVKYGDGSLWGAAGIKARWHMKDTTTGKDSTYDITVVAGNVGTTPPNPNRYFWFGGFTNVAEVQYPPTELCNAANVGKVAKGSRGSNYTCTDSQPNTPAPTQPTQPAPTQPAPTQPTQPAPTQPDPVSCSGTPPPANSSSSVGCNASPCAAPNDRNTVWRYRGPGESNTCTWTCTAPNYPNSDKTKCLTPQAGDGVTVTIVDKSGNPIPGVTISLTYNGYMGEDGGTTGANGVSEFFPIYASALYYQGNLILNKAGYNIFSAEGCTSNLVVDKVNAQYVNQAKSYCKDASVKSGTKIKIVMMPTPADIQPFTFVLTKKVVDAAGNPTGGIDSVYNNEGVFYTNSIRDHQFYAKISGVKFEDTLSCMETHAHPNRPNNVNIGHCSDPANFTPFSGNSEWSWSPSNGGTWTGDIQYSDTIYGIAGIRVKIFLKNKDTNQVANFGIATYTF